MNKGNFILLDASYINSGGGEVLLNYFLETIFKQNNFKSYIFIFDKRFIIPKHINIENSKIYIFRKNSDRFFLFLKIFIKFKPNTVFNLNNLPPPFPIFNTRCFIYFHNVLLLQNIFLKNSYKSNFKFHLKKIYIKLLNFQHYYWIVQTDLVVKLLKIELNIKSDKIIIIPFFKEFSHPNIINNNQSFIYISDGEKHKNHDFILDSWLRYYNKYKKTPNLLLTFNETKYPNLTSKVNRLREIGLDIKNIGFQKYDDILKMYNDVKYILFFSEFESFGLPLIEAAQLGKYVLTTKKEYVFQIIEPSASFDTNDIDTFVLYIYDITHNKTNLNPAVKKIENKIYHLINKIENNV